MVRNAFRHPTAVARQGIDIVGMRPCKSGSVNLSAEVSPAFGLGTGGINQPMKQGGRVEVGALCADA